MDKHSLSGLCIDQVYVQDLILQQGQVMWQLLEEGAYVYVCGDARKMVSSTGLPRQDCDTWTHRA